MSIFSSTLQVRNIYTLSAESHISNSICLLYEPATAQNTGGELKVWYSLVRGDMEALIKPNDLICMGKHWHNR